MAACPMCKEEIQPDAKKCKHCGEFLDPALRSGGGAGTAQEVQKQLELEQARQKGKRALTYGIVGFLCFGIILGPAAIVLGSSAVSTFRKYGAPPESSASVGRTLGIIVTVLWTLGIIGRIGMIAAAGGRT